MPLCFNLLINDPPQWHARSKKINIFFHCVHEEKVGSNFFLVEITLQDHYNFEAKFAPLSQLCINELLLFK